MSETPSVDIMNQDQHLEAQAEHGVKSFDNPMDLIKAFENSEKFKSFIQEREKNIKSEDERRDFEDLFRGTDTYKFQLWDFFGTHRLNYKPEIYSEDFNFKVQLYWQFTLGFERRTAYGDANVEDIEHERSRLHARAAEQLMKDFNFNNFTIARILVQFLSINEGFDVIDPDRDVRRRMIGR